MAKKIYVAEFDAHATAYERKILGMEAKTLSMSKKVQGYVMNINNAYLKMAGVFAALGGVTSFLNSSIQAYVEEEKIVKRLDTALGKHNRTLQTYASQLQKITAFADDQILDAMALISNYVKEESMIKRLTKVTLDLAVAKGIDLSSAAEMVAKTIGSSTNTLKRQGIEFDNNLRGVKRYNAVLEALTRFEGQAEAQGETYGGKLEQLKNQFGDLQEQIGEGLLPTLMEFSNSLSGIATQLGTSGITELIDNWLKLATIIPRTLTLPGIKLLASLFGGGGAKINLNDFIMQSEAFTNDIMKMNSGLGDGTGSGTKTKITGGAAGNFGASALRNFAGGLPNPSANGLSGKGGGFNMSEVAVPFFDIDQIMQDAAYNFTSAFDDTINIAYQMKNIFGDTAGSFVDTVIEGAQTVSSILSAINSAVSVLGFLGLKEGGSVVNSFGSISYSRVPKFASGSSFMVPPGFPNDSFPIMVQSGERVDVTPAHRAGNNKGIEGRLDALNANLVSMLRGSKGGSSSISVFGKIESGDIYLSNKKGTRILGGVL